MARANTSTFPYLAAVCLAFGEAALIVDAARTLLSAVAAQNHTTTHPDAATTTFHPYAADSTSYVRRCVCALLALCSLLWRFDNRCFIVARGVLREFVVSSKSVHRV